MFLLVGVALVEEEHHRSFHHDLHHHTDQGLKDDPRLLQLEYLIQGRYVSHANYSSSVQLEFPLLMAPFSHSAKNRFDLKNIKSLL